jgi:hypothetical protein
MSIVRVGTTKKYADGWESIFGGKRSPAKKSPNAAAKGKKKKRATSRKK